MFAMKISAITKRIPMEAFTTSSPSSTLSLGLIAAIDGDVVAVVET